MRLWAALLLFVLAASACVYAEVSVWQECRASHSWLYCVRTLAP